MTLMLSNSGIRKKSSFEYFPLKGTESEQWKCREGNVIIAGSGRKNIYLVIRILYIDFFEVSLQTKHGRLHYNYRTRSACYQS